MSATIGQIARDSAIGRVLQALGRVSWAAWNTSRTARLVRGGDTRWRGITSPLRIRVVALMVASVSAGQIVSLWVMPPYTRSGVPMIWFITAAALAVVAAVAAVPLASAWPGSKTAKAVDTAIGERYS